MRNYDLTPLFRTTVGFDRMSNILNSAMKEMNYGEQSYPPYNIIKNDEDSYSITLAVAGFSEDEIDIVVENNTLTVSGKSGKDEEKEYLFKGIAQREFERKFQLADHIKVVDADMQNGLLNIDMKREIPEAMKPKKITINTKRLENKKAA